MPKLVINVLSDVQSDIGDLAKEIIQNVEYLDLLNLTINDVARETETWVARWTGTPVTVTGSTPVFSVFVPYKNAANEVIAPYRILRAIRTNGLQTLETREYSIQTIQSTGAGNLSFSGNTSIVPMSAFATQRDSTDGFVLTFPSAILLDETIVIDFITSQPYDLEVWDASLISGKVTSNVSLAVKQDFANQNQAIQSIVPDFIYPTIRYGLLFRILERMFMQGNMNIQAQLGYAKNAYDKEMRKSKFHAQMPKDNQSSIQHQAHNFLPE